MIKSIKKFKNHLKIFIFISCITYILYSLYNNSEILDDVYQKKFSFYTLLIVNVVFANIICLRAFLFIKGSVGYSYSYIDWAKLHFESKLLDCAIDYSGAAYKAVQLKKRSIGYTKYVSISYFLLGLYISITLIFIVLALLLVNKIYIPAFLAIVVFLILIIFLSPLIIKTFLDYLVRLKKLNKYVSSIENLTKILNNIYLKKKTLLISIALTAIVHLIELIIFYTICGILLDNINIKFIIGFFGANFIINRIPFVSGIPGVHEITLGIISLPFGIFFIEGVIIALLIRILTIISNLINSGIFFILIFFDKNKLIN